MPRRHRPVAVLAAACAGVIVCASTPSRAATATFDNGGSDGGLWSNNVNWSGDAAVDGNDAKFSTATASLTQGAVTSVVDADRSVLSLGYNQFALSGGTLFHTTQINDGLTLTVNGSTGANNAMMYVGSGADSVAANNLTYTSIVNQGGTPASASGGGTLRLDNAAGDLVVRQTSNNTASGSRMATLDLSGLSHLNANIRNLNVAVGDPSTAALNRALGTMYLAYDNTINTNSVSVGVNTNNGTLANPAGRLFFGQTNVLNTNAITVGGMQTGNNLAGFNPTVSGGSLIIRGAGGVGRADFSIGAQLVGVNSGTSSLNNVVDFNGGAGFGAGAVNAQVGTLLIGRAGSNTSAAAAVRNATGTLTLGAGTFDANNVVLGDDNNTANASVGTGTLNVNAAAQLVANSSFTLGKKVNAGLSVANGTLNISGATASARVGAAITDGGGSSTINVNTGGTLQARGLGSSASRIDAMTVDTGTVVVDVSGGLPAAGTSWGYVNNLTANGANTVGLRFAPGTLTAGATIQAIDYTTLGGVGFGSFTMAKQPARVAAHLSQGASSIDIVIDSADSPKWDGTVNGDWDIQDQPTPGGGTANWKLITAGTATKYQEDLVTYSTTDSILFDDTAAGTTTVNVATTVAPNAVSVNNSDKAYTFSGTGKITGATGITKSGTNTLTFANTGGNDFTGALVIENGTVNTTANEVLPNSGAVNVAGGTFALGTQTETIGTVSLASGSLTVGTGSLVAGTVNVTGGSLNAGTGTVAANIMNFSGGSVAAGGGAINVTTLNLSGGVTISPAGGTITATTINLDNATLGAGAVTPATINALSGTIHSTVGGAGIISKVGTGTVTITGNNSYTGGTRLAEGIILLTSDNALGSTSGNTFIENGGNSGAGSLQLSGGINVPEPITLSGRRGFTPTNTPPYNFNPHIINNSGNNTLSGDITFFTGGTNYNLGADAGKLTIAGNLLNPITASPAITRFLHLRGAAEGEITGNILTTGSETTDIVKLDAGTWTISGSANGPIGNTVVEAGKLAFAGPSYRAAAIDVRAGALGEVSGGAGGTRVLVAANTLTVAGKLNLVDNKLITRSAAGTWDGGSAYTGVAGLVDTGRGAAGNALWDGATGIVTTDTRAINNGDLLAIGVVDASDKFRDGLGAPIAETDTATFAGQTVTGADTLVMVTWGGDANLDGKINIDDYGQIDSNVSKSGTVFGWNVGDFNYDGKINIDDYGIIDGNIGRQTGTIPTSGGVGASAGTALDGVAAVPEPASLSLFALGAASLLRRTRRSGRA